MKTLKLILFKLLILGAAAAGWAETESGCWNTLRQKTLVPGVSEEQVDQALGQCRSRGMSAEDATLLLQSVSVANVDGLPADCIFLRIEEGLAKQVDPERVAEVAAQRLACLREAQQLVELGRSGGGGAHQRLIVHTCMALESGLPADVLRNVFSRSDGFRYGRMIHVVEAGETLQLAGLDPKDIQQIMNDCLDRGLSGYETERMMEILLDGHRAGESFTSTYSILWVEAD